MEYLGSEYRLSTGRTIPSHEGILGIGLNDDTLYDAFDDTIVYDEYDGVRDTPQPPKLTPAERREIAEHMIARWQRWAEAQEPA